MNNPILIVDDEVHFLNSAARKLRMEGFNDVTALADPVLAAETVKKKTFDLALLDITMPVLNGLDLLEKIKAKSPQTECIMITAQQDIALVIKAVRLGAYDYLVKPLQPDQLMHTLRRALERKNLVELLLLRQEEDLSRGLETPAAFEEIITVNEKMLRLLREAELHARSDIPILITGETGVGKELLARAIHRAGFRSRKPFVAVNMLALSPNLFESEFFGHAKGAFTGAIQDKAGYLDQAGGGALFLDEIGDLAMEVQGKLLRVLQEKEFTPVGRTRPKKADVRMIAATNQDLETLVREGRFRKDLYYRLRYASLRLPPLRERKDDLRLLARNLLKNSSRPKATISPEAEAVLMRHDWPGNVRELRGALEAAANLAEERIILPQHLRLPPADPPRAVRPDEVGGDIEPLAEVERRHILAVYHALKNNKTRTAEKLGVSQATLWRKLKAYQVE
ncbi:MAG: sigma-54 dependent transcriptional regulator [Pseudomonadota bacterium]